MSTFDDVFCNSHLTYWLFSQDIPSDPLTRITICPFSDVISDLELKLEISSYVKEQVKLGLQKKNELFIATVKQYAQEVTVATIDKAFRSAAAANKVNELEILYRKISTIDAQDNNPQRKRTTLHWAVEKKAINCVKWLLERGAKSNIVDANGKTVLDYANQTNSPEIRELFGINAQLSQAFRTMNIA